MSKLNNTSKYALNTFNLMSTRINDLSAPFTNVITSTGTGMFQVIVNAGTQLNHSTLGKLFLSTVNNSVPQIANGTMVNHLEVNGKIAVKKYKLLNGSPFDIAVKVKFLHTVEHHED